jgi:hypothetical protein
MKIDVVRLNLANIVLLAKEYREQVPVSIDDEIRQLKKELKYKEKEDENSSSYDRKYLEDLKKDRRKSRNHIFKQIIYFTEKTLLQFGRKGSEPRDIETNQKKVDSAKKDLTKDEINLLGALYELYINLMNFQWYRLEEYKPKKVRELKSIFMRLIDQAVRLDPSVLTASSNSAITTGSRK